MKESEARSLPLGLYRLYWGRFKPSSSLASVGQTGDGMRWYAPVNWITDVASTDWSIIDRVERIDVTGQEEEPEPVNKLRFKLFDIEWPSPSNVQQLQSSAWVPPIIGTLKGRHKIFGFTDDHNWAYNANYRHPHVQHYEIQPCDDEGNRLYAIGRLE